MTRKPTFSTAISGILAVGEEKDVFDGLADFTSVGNSTLFDDGVKSIVG